MIRLVVWPICKGKGVYSNALISQKLTGRAFAVVFDLQAQLVVNQYQESLFIPVKTVCVKGFVCVRHEQ